MKFVELIKKDKKELTTLLAEKRDKLRALRFGLAAGRAKNIREVRVLKRDIAKILTKISNI
ncbi:MAG: 50S ribosomal protein L29 [Patescibacteria group bacterium]